MDQYVAPTEVHQRYGALLQESASDTRYLAGVKEWTGCMSKKGFEALDPFSVSNLVADEAARIVGSDGISISEEGEPWVLSEDQFEDLQVFELGLFRQDSTCRTSTSLNDAMLALEGAILAQLQREFPDFAGAPA
jgi:hypothetical protein